MCLPSTILHGFVSSGKKRQSNIPNSYHIISQFVGCLLWCCCVVNVLRYQPQNILRWITSIVDMVFRVFKETDVLREWKKSALIFELFKYSLCMALSRACIGLRISVMKPRYYWDEASIDDQHGVVVKQTNASFFYGYVLRAQFDSHLTCKVYINVSIWNWCWDWMNACHSSFYHDHEKLIFVFVWSKVGIFGGCAPARDHAPYWQGPLLIVA